MNLYTAAKDCNVHKVLALLGLFSLVCYCYSDILLIFSNERKQAFLFR